MGNSAPREVAELAQQEALLADARRRLAAATAARVSAERALGDARNAHATAVSASGAKRDDDALADAASRAAVRLEHATATARAAAEENERAVKDVELAIARLATATTSKECAELLAAHDDPAIDDELAAHGAAMARAVCDLRDHVLAVRKILAADVDRVARLRALGGTSPPPRDGVGAAAAWLAALAARGGAMANGQELHQHRWAFAIPEPLSRDPWALDAIRTLVAVAGDVLEQGIRHQQAGVSYGRGALERVASVYARHRHYIAARDELQGLAKADERARNERDARAHEARLEAAAESATRAAINARHLQTSRAAEAARLDAARRAARVGGDGETVARSVPSDLPPHPTTRRATTPRVG
jgi:hypothetical protein